MKKHREWISLTCSLLSIAAYSVAITCSADAQSESKMMYMKSSISPSKVSNNNNNNIPPPASGIKLIEYISQKMHSIKGPVIAKQSPFTQAPIQEKNAGPTNQLLAIKPPLSGFHYGFAPREADREVVPAERKSNEDSKARKKGQSQSQSEEARDSKDKESRASDAFANDESYVQTVASRRRASRPDGASYIATKEGATGDKTDASSAYARMQANLGKSLARFGGAIQAIGEAQRLAESPKADMVAPQKAKPTRVEASATKVATKNSANIWDRNSLMQSSPGIGGGYSNSANVRDTRSTTEAGSTSFDDNGPTPQQAQAQAPPMSAGYYKNVHVMGKMAGAAGDNQYSAPGIRDYRRQVASVPATAPAAPAASAAPSGLIPPPPPALTFGGAFGSAGEQSQQYGRHNSNYPSSSNKKTEIAMLPPNVITGIPLVRLGSSAIDANRALASVKGKLNKQSISGWTVLVLHKANSTEPAMHVYMRHGLVEALRIFDGAFIAPDFGVQLNDDVQTVKSKFGEPGFMLPEPECPATQNYVYPISQVSFQLARPNMFSTPKVVSVLIFTVK